jgi:hypothetical protein
MMVEFGLKKFYWKYFEILQVYNKFRGKPNKYPFAEFHNDIKKTDDNEINKNLENFFKSNDFNTFIANYSVVENNGEIELTALNAEIDKKNKSQRNEIENESQIETEENKNTKYKSNKRKTDESQNKISPLTIGAIAAVATTAIIMSNQDNKGGNLVSIDKIKEIIYNKIINIKNKKYPISKIAIVPNLDEHWQSGSHWVALYADLKKGNIYFFDSYGYRPEPRLRGLAKRIAEWKYKKDTGKELIIDDIEKWMTEGNKNQNEIEKKYDIRYSTIRNQYKNSECGVYSMNFIIRLLNGSKFDDIIKEKLDDDIVNQCREIYFNNQKIIPENSKENFLVTDEKGGKIDITKHNYKCE